MKGNALGLSSSKFTKKGKREKRKKRKRVVITELIHIVVTV